MLKRKREIIINRKTPFGLNANIKIGNSLYINKTQTAILFTDDEKEEFKKENYN